MKDKKLQEKLYTECEAADYFNWSLATMREIRKRGEIEHLIFNDKTIRYTEQQLLNFKNEHLARGKEKSGINKQNDNS